MGFDMVLYGGDRGPAGNVAVRSDSCASKKKRAVANFQERENRRSREQGIVHKVLYFSVYDVVLLKWIVQHRVVRLLQWHARQRMSK